MKTRTLIATLSMASPAFAATIIADNFDSGAVSSEWDVTAGLSIGAGGAEGSPNFVNLAGSSGRLGERLNGATDFTLDYYFQIQDTGDRRFSLMVSTFTGNISTGNATINLRYQDGAWGVYSGANSQFMPVPGLNNTVTPGEWYHMQVEGNGWGATGANYTIRLSDAGGSAFTSEGTVNTVHNGSIVNPGSTSGGSTYTGRAEFFVFNTEFGSNPGFALDNIVVTAVPEASTLALLAASLPLLRRRRA